MNTRQAPSVSLKMRYIYLVIYLTLAQMSKQYNTSRQDTYKLYALNSQCILIFAIYVHK